MSRYKAYYIGPMFVFALLLIVACSDDDSHPTQSHPQKPGDHWSVQSLPTSAIGIVWDGMRFVAVTAADTTLVATDARNWKAKANALSGHMDMLHHYAGVYVARWAGESLAYSTDSLVWLRCNYRNSWPVEDIVDGAGMLALVSAGDGIYTSHDGATWEWIYHTNYRIDAICWNGSQFVATNGLLSHTSPDGVTWTVHRVNGGGIYLTTDYMACNDSLFVAVGNDRFDSTTIMIHTSTDGINWNSDTLTGYQPVNDIVWTGEQFLACGNKGQVLVSSDGLKWRVIMTKTSSDLYQIALSHERWVIVGSDRTILVSP